MKPKPFIIIAVDGYSSTGKSSFAKLVASRYRLLYLDSGALYRAVTLFSMENGFIGPDGFDASLLKPFLENLDIRFRRVEDGVCHTFIGGRDVEKDIRSMSVSSNVSSVAANPFVRRYVDSLLRSYAVRGGHGCQDNTDVQGVIMDGRDIGTTVFPDANLKIFMTADVKVRAERRAAELRAKGEDVSMEEVMVNLKERDWADSHREVSPLVQAPDAIVLDNTDMTFDDQMAWIASLLEQKFGMA